MSVKKIVRYPDPFLRKPTEVVGFTDPHWDELSMGTFLDLGVKSAFDTLYQFDKGAALAANQIGLTMRFFVINKNQPVPEGCPLVIINPEIISRSEETLIETEGCLSFPGIKMDVERSKAITVSYQGVEGWVDKIELTDWMARVFQHEIDHLNGKLFVDRLPKEARMEIAMRIGRRK